MTENLPHQKQWFALRDLKRANAKLPGYKQLSQAGFDVFTPLQTRLVVREGKRVRESVPFISDLLFVFSTRDELDPVIASTASLQYRFVKGNGYGKPLVVRTIDMDRFITAVRSMSSPRYVQLSEITPSMCGAQIRIVGPGPLNGYEGFILKVRGSHKKRLLLELKGFLGVIVEISDTDYIQLL